MKGDVFFFVTIPDNLRPVKKHRKQKSKIEVD